jgi:3-(3-hydroxy-phenyl)propionate hydroxylase
MSSRGVQRRLQNIHPKSGDYDAVSRALCGASARGQTFRKGRVLLAGDSAHVNNPIGGMGMNGGIHEHQSGREAADVRFPRRSQRVRSLHAAARKAQTDFVQAQTIQNKVAEEGPAIRHNTSKNCAASPGREAANSFSTASLFMACAPPTRWSRSGVADGVLPPRASGWDASGNL